MKRMTLRHVGMLTCAGAVLAMSAAATTAVAKKPKPGGPPCGPDACTMEYDPVLCADGNVYSNACVASQHCQTDCEHIGPGPVPVPW
jgi:crotonobetainyl-CoA:carnitine CoA-transferase CaiB-like acyl-CoA transferase